MKTTAKNKTKQEIILTAANISLLCHVVLFFVCRFKFLSDLDLLPTIFGADWRFIYLQKLKGTVTIVPDVSCSLTMQYRSKLYFR
jgi:hypothetical protein